MKKKILFAMLLICMCYLPTAYAVNTQGCETVLPGIILDTKIPNTVHTIIVVIKIAVPVLLVVFGMLDLFKGITAQKEDEIKKAQQLFIKRLISGAIVFFVISVVQLLVSFVADDSGGIMNCANCFLNGTEASGVCK